MKVIKHHITGIFCLIMGFVFTFMVITDLKICAIWRGPGVDSKITLSNDPIDYYLFLIMEIIFAVVSYCGAMWLLFLADILHKKGKL